MGAGSGVSVVIVCGEESGIKVPSHHHHGIFSVSLVNVFLDGLVDVISELHVSWGDVSTYNIDAPLVYLGGEVRDTEVALQFLWGREDFERVPFCVVLVDGYGNSSCCPCFSVVAIPNAVPGFSVFAWHAAVGDDVVRDGCPKAIP